MAAVAASTEYPRRRRGAAATRVQRRPPRKRYNPYTLSGTIVVDGVVASCHSSWILDGLAPPRVLAKVYQRLFVVPRAAYKLIGADGMDAVFGVGNTGATASIASQTAMLFGVLSLTLLAVGAGAKAVLGV